MKLKELSEKSGISDRTIRYYISDGIFIPEKYTENYLGRKNYDYTENDLIKLEQIALLRKYDFSIKEIKCLFDNELDIQKVLSEHIGDSKKASETYGENILKMEQALKERPKNAFELCKVLSNPVVESMPIPTIDEQSAYKPMYKKTQSNNKKLIAAVIIMIVFSCALTIRVIKDFRQATDNRNQSVLNYVGIEDRKEFGKHITVFKNPVMYKYVLELSGLDLSISDVYIPLSQSALFPRNLDNKTVSNFYCEYYEYLPIGEGCQFLLEIKYDEKEYKTEKDRISKIANSKIQFDETNFSLPAYVTVYGFSDIYEYALINADEKSIAYIYIQSVKKKDLTLESKYLPKDFKDYCNEGENAYDIYSNSKNNGVLIPVG